MKSIRCPQCGFVTWESSQWCKRCKFILKTPTITPPNASAGSQSNFSGAQPSNNQQNAHSQTDRKTYQNSYANTQQTSYRKPAADAENSFLIKNIERCNRNLMIVCVIVILAVLSGGLLSSKYLLNVVLGAKTLDQDTVAFSNRSLADSMRNYVKINADEVYDTGAAYVRKSKYNVETVETKYVLLGIKDKLLLAEIGAFSPIADGAKNVTLEGELTTIPPNVSEKVLEPLYSEEPAVRSAVLPMILKAKGDFQTPAYIGIGIGAGVLLIAGICLWSALKQSGNPENTSVVKSLAAYGSPSQVAAQIDYELAGQYEKVGSIYLLPTWIIKNNTFSVEVQHIENIVWMYKKVTKHSVNFIPTGKTYEVVLHNSQGSEVSLNGTFMSEQKTEQMMERIYQRIPWVVAGYDDELISYWNSNKNGFIEDVRARRQNYENNFAQTQQA